MVTKKKTDKKLAFVFKSPCETIKLLLKTNAIPYLIIDYGRNYLYALIYRHNTFIYCLSEFDNFNIGLKILPIQEKNVLTFILQATRVTVDRNIITDEMYCDLLDSINQASEILRSKLIQVNNSKGTGFTESDFITLGRLAVKAKQDIEFWET